MAAIKMKWMRIDRLHCISMIFNTKNNPIILMTVLSCSLYIVSQQQQRSPKIVLLLLRHFLYRHFNIDYIHDFLIQKIK